MSQGRKHQSRASESPVGRLLRPFLKRFIARKKKKRPAIRAKGLEHLYTQLEAI